MKKLILAAMMGLAGAVFADKVDLSQYKWAVIGDSLSDPNHPSASNPVTKYYHYLAESTGIQVVYTNGVGSTGYMKEINQTYGKCFYRRLLENPLPSDVDVVTIMGSVNDNTLAPWDYSAGRVSDALPETTNVASYINRTIDVIREQAPKAKIILMTGLYYKGTAQEKYQRCMDILRKIAAFRCIEFHDWLTPNPDDPLDFHNIDNADFAKQYAVDWQNGSIFGHPNDKYNEEWLAPHFEAVLAKALTNPDPIAPPSVNLSQYKWAVIGDAYSDTKSSPLPKYVDIVSEKTGIKIPYENAATTGYWANNAKDNAFYQRIQAKPVPSDVDLITLYGTVQDHNFDSTRYDADPDNDIYPGNPSDRFPTKSYAAYVNAAIDALVDQAPCAKIVMVGPLYHSGISDEKLNNINRTLAAVSAYRGVEFHDWLNGQAGDPLDYHQITTDQAFFETYVNDRNGRTMGKNNWYGDPTRSYHAEWIGPQMLSIVSNALAGTGAPMVAPELAPVRVIPWGSSAVFYGSFAKIGSGAMAGDVYLAYGESPDSLCEPFKILEGKSAEFEYELKGLKKNTKYHFALTAKNDAATPMTSEAVTGSFTTVEEDRKDWSAKKWAVIGDSISDPTHPWGNGTQVTKYYRFVARDTGIQVVYTNAYGSTGYEHQNSVHHVAGFYARLKDEANWRIPSDVDVVTIFGSVNDCDKWNHIGNASDRFEDGKSSYSAYVNGTVDLVRKYAPNARIILVSGIYYHGVNQDRFRMVTDAVRAVAEFQGVMFYDWLTEDPNDPLDFHNIADDPLADGSFARQYAVDWENMNTTKEFGHPNDLYNEVWLSPHFRAILAEALTNMIVLDEPAARPSTNYNGSAVSVAFTGDIDEGVAISAKVTLGGVDYVGVITDSTASFALPADVVTAGNTYDGTITVTVGDKNYTKDVTLAQGRFKVDEDADWICESAAALDATGTWSGDQVAATEGQIEVSNAVFTAAKPSVAGAVVTIDSTFEFVGPNEDPFSASDLAGVKVVKVGKTKRYAFLTGSGIVTNLDAIAIVRSAVAVKTVIDFGANTIAYTVGGTEFGPYPGFASASSVSGVRYAGGTKVASLDGAYRYEGLDTNLAMAGGVEYATVAEAVAAGKGGVELLWDTTWEPSAAGDFIFTKNGFTLAIGGPLAYSVKDNGDGTVTVTVTGGETPDAPSAASITLVGDTVKVGVADAQANCWYALEKTTDLTKDFAVDAATWTKGSDLLAGSGELSIALGADAQAFYRVVVSATAP